MHISSDLFANARGATGFLVALEEVNHLRVNFLPPEIIISSDASRRSAFRWDENLRSSLFLFSLFSVPRAFCLGTVRARESVSRVSSPALES